ncbi:hypothetical protein P2G88_05110 [Aliiglaciecola sp. CAU 1673]|uniref:hypothetical protein n=1 Tax=Aliiglaciecola sp. CAU 1673 TaxID=3032595 RepID=UPI0023D98685|nr:hypothetical protein [Aliiglaciecola sp. CAU 1673]MDF2177623.1 hypothetical protein [Aliiglaciecola sp. CAU 1673]
MTLLQKIGFLLELTRTQGIIRRYMVVNGFDGALTMLGLLIGFVISPTHDLKVVISACLGAAVALGVSGVSSAYISESAERQHALNELQQAMAKNMQDTAHGQAARWVPLVVALANGFAPFCLSLCILLPLFLANHGLQLPASPLTIAIAIAFVLIFFLGVYLARLTKASWLKSGLQTALVAGVTVVLIYLLAGD